MGAISELIKNDAKKKTKSNSDSSSCHSCATEEGNVSPHRTFSSLRKRLSKRFDDRQDCERSVASTEFSGSPASNSTPSRTRPEPGACQSLTGSAGLRSSLQGKKSTRNIVVGRMRSLTPVKFRKGINPPPLTCSGDTDRRVRFVDEVVDASDVEGSERPALVSIMETLPELSEQESKDVFWTRKEMSKIASKSKRLAEDVAFKQDRRVLACLEYMYDSGSSENTKESAGEMKAALEYFFSFQVEVSEGSSHPSNGSSSHTRKRRTTTNLRGLEKQIMVVRSADRRTACIQAVLSMQSILESTNTKSKESPEAIIAKESMRTSAASRRLARVFGKGDEAAAHSAQ